MSFPSVLSWRLPVSRFRAELSPESLLLLFSLYWALAANRPVWGAVHQGLGAGRLLGVVALLALIHYLVLAPWMAVRVSRPLLLALSAVAALGSYFTQSLGVVLDPAMMRNLMRTDWREARELVGPGLLGHVAVLLLPVVLVLVQVRPVRSRTGWAGMRRRLGWWLTALLGALVLLWVLFQPLSGLMRMNKGLRYQMLPVAPLWSLPRSVWQDMKEAQAPRQPIGLDAKAGPTWAAAQRPRVLVWVVGETVRAANWGAYTLPEGGVRDTAPLTGIEPQWLRFPRMTTCGTDTETSLPCMFAPTGRRAYDEAQIRGQESLLHVLQRAGVQTEWWDAQSGCKGVCAELPQRRLDCGELCDRELFAGLAPKLQAIRQSGPGTHLLVLHMLGNHGPSYYRRYGSEHARFQPACQSDDLGRCSQAEIRNAYDNALLATDALLADALKQLRALQGEMDVALLFTPDHGESLGEKGLFLHGMPFSFAPREQTEVPMLFWLSEGWRATRGWSADCLSRLPKGSAPQHDHLFHTALNLLDVRTALYEPTWDLLQPCAAR
ncbi:lipid A ethanolaminephosphotransferase [Inhella inkyongensis]|uniref:Lipid A ethanolaminephosphotransferase n=1 Tax=Inhella inkyongensis TaxID=392593 RepID=A0A840S8T8_9BURK|nr:sulfatase-like hydrolase/transferase [Inhella inkyongensis]MBB5204829.1 lipid A ethanolaminephosphotransferase [Inhella inkyongensis]